MLRAATPFEKYLRHPIEALGVGIVWMIFRILPLDTASAVGGFIARSIGPILPASGRARANIRRALPEKSDAELEHIVRGMWDNLGRVVAEFPHIEKLRFDDSDPHIHVEGRNYLTAFRDDALPGLFFSGHIGNWELAPLTAVAHGVETTFVYREANNRLVENLFVSGRRTLGDGLIKKGSEGAKGIMKALRDDKHVGMLVDQKMNDGIAVPFFGEDAMTAPALALMAIRFRCPVMPARVIRERGAYFRIELSEPIYAEDTGDKETDIRTFTTQINEILEGWIREHPDQWLWLHNRWPKEPNGQTNNT